MDQKALVTSLDKFVFHMALQSCRVAVDFFCEKFFFFMMVENNDVMITET